MRQSQVGLLSLLSLTAMFVCGAAQAQQTSPNPTIAEAPAVSGLAPDHATLSVENMDRETDWYVRVLGFKLVPETKPNPNPHMIHQRLTIPGYEIHLIKYKGSKRPASIDPLYLQQGWIHVVFHVADPATTVKELQALHVTPKEVNSDKDGPRRILLRDPENNEIEITRSQP